MSGLFTYADALYTPGSGISQQSDQYDFFFVFGSQTFTDADNTLDLTFIVANSGTTVSSIAGIFVNNAGSELRLLTPGTVTIRLGSEGADTFAEGSRCTVTAPAAIQLPASIWLFGSVVLMLPLLMRARVTPEQ